MKFKYLISLIGTVGISLGFFNFAVAQSTFTPTATVGVINDFSVTAEINEDSSVNISEKITYDFGSYDRHGIFRDIPIKYQVEQVASGASQNIEQLKGLGKNYNLRISDIAVTDEKGKAYNFTTGHSGRYLNIKVGDADKFVSGVKIYVIEYKIDRAISFFDDHDEFYWNVTGDEWQEPILSSGITLTLPESAGGVGAIPKDKIKQACYTGGAGSTLSMCTADIDNAGRINFSLEHGYKLTPGQGFTIALSWPKSIVQPPSKYRIFFWILKDNLGLLYSIIAPLLVFAALFVWWFKRGRDPEGRGTIIAQYEAPANLTAQEVGVAVDEKADNLDISSLIISLAVKGYLKIREVDNNKAFGLLKEKDYLLIRLNSDYAGLKDFEIEFMDKVFGSDNLAKSEVKLSELKNKFYKHIDSLKGKIYESLVSQGYFSKNPDKIRTNFIAAAIAWGVIGTIFSIMLFEAPITFFANMVMAAIIAFFGMIMPKKTVKGVEAKEHILGLKEYLSVAEKDRLKFHNAPEKKPETFEKFLPYAMVLGVEEQWGKQFQDIYRQPPEWYEGGRLDGFNSYYLVHSLSGMQTTANAAFVSKPSGGAGSGGSGFGGGGFSGGGFGGGGGGSW